MLSYIKFNFFDDDTHINSTDPNEGTPLTTSPKPRETNKSPKPRKSSFVGHDGRCTIKKTDCTIGNPQLPF